MLHNTLKLQVHSQVSVLLNKKQRRMHFYFILTFLSVLLAVHRSQVPHNKLTLQRQFWSIWIKADILTNVEKIGDSPYAQCIQMSIFVET